MISLMAQIHPTAIVDYPPGLADNVVVGPLCILRGKVNIGAGTRLLHRVTMQGPVNIGEKNLLYPNVCIGYAPQDFKFDSAKEGSGVVIGHSNVFREGVTVHRGSGDAGDPPTSIGDRNFFMVNSHVAHDCNVGSDIIMVNGSLLAGHVTVQNNAILGGNAAVHQFVRIGRLAMLGGGAVLTKDLPPFCVARESRGVGSLNLVGLRRSGLRDSIKPLKEGFDILYRHRHTNPRAIELIMEKLGDDPLCRELAQFVAQTKRGITSYRPSDEE
ncbi:MAG: acyl-ACP--UDP-N-acetylglucosamine O-acyltransferase [Planctomycetes bacterium]|nr:acyl-ACP--UDP-N-acetylglucosamine O-acyltransferase [Planctomycetota bacterium]